MQRLWGSAPRHHSTPTALGMQAKATQKDSVALGAGSVDRAATKETKGTIALSDGTIRDYKNFAAVIRSALSVQSRIDETRAFQKNSVRTAPML